MSFLAESGVHYDPSNPPMAINTAAGIFLVPTEIGTSLERIGRYTGLLEFCVTNRYSPDDFISRCADEGLPVSEDHLHRDFYRELRDLDAENKKGIGARIIKNAFAPLFTSKVDYVAGNPPWVNWEYLPEDYRVSMIAGW